MGVRIDPTLTPALVTPTEPQAPGTPPPTGSGTLALHTATPQSHNPAQEFINVLMSAAIRAQPDNKVRLPRFQSSNLPSSIVGTGIRFAMAWAPPNFTPDTHCFGRYVIRHNLPSLYNIAVAGYPPLTGSTDTRIIIDVTEVREWRIDIRGPAGPMPEGWFIEAVKLSNEAAYDNPALPQSHPSRVFVPEFLEEMRKWKPAQKRFMKAMATEAATIPEYYPDIAGLYNTEYEVANWIYPRDVMVSLCNEFDIEPYFNLASSASDALVTSFATYVRDNLKPSLSVVSSCANEYWNPIYNGASNRYLMAPTWQKFKTKGQGTVTIDKEARTMTFTGAPDIRTFRPGATQVNVCVGNFVFGLHMEAVVLNGREVAPEPTATTAHILFFTDDFHIFDAVDAEYWYSPDANELPNRGYTMVATRQQKIWADVFEAGGQRARLVNVWESQLASPGRFSDFTDTSWWRPFADYIDPLTVFDAVAVNPYFGNGTFGSIGRSATELGADGKALLLDNDITAYIRPFAINKDYPAYSRALRDYMLDRPIPGVNPSSRSITTYLHNASKSWNNTISPYSNTTTGKKLRLIAYEGGAHIIHSVLEPANRATDQDIVEAFVFGFLQSPEATEVFAAWAELHLRRYDGPVMQFNFVQAFTRFGAYGLIPFFGGPSDSRQELLLDQYVDRAPWWTDASAPQAVAVPDQQWTAGVDPGFTLDDWVSNNATVFSGTPPAGMMLDGATGALTGRPLAGYGIYSFTASNFAGSVEVSIRIQVSS